MDLKKIHLNFSALEVSEMLIDLYQGSFEDAMLCAVLVKSQIPMYTGNLNPVWKFWEDVTKILMPNSNEDQQLSFFREVVAIDRPYMIDK